MNACLSVVQRIAAAKLRPILVLAVVGAVLLISQFNPFGGVSRASAEQGGVAGIANPYTWGVIGSSGSPDDGSDKKISFNGQYATVRSPGTVVLRYNIETFPPTEADGAQLWVRMRDDGGDARVFVRFKQSSILTGETETIASYDSNDLPPSNKYELDSVDICGFEWDFYNYLYYVEVRMERRDSGGHPGLAAIQISELYCE